MRRQGSAEQGRRRPTRNEDGAALVEFAMVVGLFAFILYGLISFGMVVATKQRVTSAAADGARAAVGAPDIATAQLQARERVEAKLGTTGYLATYVADPTNCPAPAECIKVSIAFDLPPAPGLGLVTPSTTTSDAVVRFK